MDKAGISSMDGDSIKTNYYAYDALNRLSRCQSTHCSALEIFYKNNVRCTDIEGKRNRSMFNGGGRLLAQRDHSPDSARVTLLANTLSHTVVSAMSESLCPVQPCLAYGFNTQDNADSPLPAFNGEHADPSTGHYLLGNGYRAFNPLLMRFNSPDSWSPFGAGGINSYGYCAGDPINYSDPSGHAFLAVVSRGLRRFAQRRQLNVMYSQAPAAKQQVDGLAGRLADKYRGAVIEAPLKSKERAWEKIINTFGGDTSKINDIARNTLIVKQRNIGSVVKDLKLQGASIKVIPPLPGGGGYRGVHVTIRTRSGLLAEMQVHAPNMIVANMPEEVARGALSAQNFNHLNSFATRNGYSIGKGHSIYEVVRDVNKSIRVRDEAASNLRDYYGFMNDGFVRL